jgi:hypothetical protein
MTACNSDALGLACAMCHGRDGNGGRVSLMMQTIDVPDITWNELTTQQTDTPPYTEGTLKGA